MEEWIRRISHGKAAIDRGFSRVGPGLRAEGAADAALSGGAGRVVRLTNAVVLLCKHHYAEECGPLLRSLAAAALAMRWFAAAGEEECRTLLGSPPQDLDWMRLAMDPRWIKRLGRAGVSDAEREGLARALADRDHVLMPGDSSGLPWSHVFPEGRKPACDPEETLKLAVRAMSHALRALDARWEGSFPGAEELWPGS